MSSFLGGGGGASASPGSIFATGNIVLYVATTGSDSNPGTLAQPFATIQHAVNVGSQYNYLSIYTLLINVADGTYDVSTNHPTVQLPFIVNPLDSPQLVGDTTTPANCIISNTGSDSCVACSSGVTNWIVFGFRLDVRGFTPCMSVQGGSIEFDNIEFANSFGDGVFTCLSCMNSSRMVWDGTYMAVIPSAANRFANVAVYGLLDLSFGLAFNFPVALALGQQFLAIQEYSTFRLRGVSYTNFAGVTGNRLFATNGATFLTDNGLVTDIPGSTTGTLDATIEWVSRASKFCTFFNNSTTTYPTTGNASPGFYAVFKDTTDGPRLLTINDGGVVYARQIGTFINTQTLSYTLQLFDQDGIVEMNVAGANTLTVPLNASVAFPIGTLIMVTQAGAGATTVAGAGGVTVHNAGVLAAQWAVARLYKRGTDEWVMSL